MRSGIVATLALAIAVSSPACGGSAPATVEARNATAPEPATPKPTFAQPEYVAAFDQVWQTIRDRHWDGELVGESWDAVRAELRPRVEAAATAKEAREVLHEMLGRLGQSHFGIIPAAVYGDVEDETRSDSGGGHGILGLTVRMAGDRALVVAVEPGGPAASAAVRPGWVIEAVGDKTVDELVAKLTEALGYTGHRNLAIISSIDGKLGGSLDAAITVVFRDGTDAPISLDLTPAPAPGRLVQFGNLPAVLVEYESKPIGKSIGYIAFNIFLDPANVIASFKRDLAAFRGRTGVVIDLRGNPGGLGAMAMGMGGFVVAEKSSLGTMITKDSKLEFVLNPQPGAFAGKVAILVDELCASTCEILAGGLRDIGRARLFGTRTAGAALPSEIVELSTGDRFQYAIANYISAGGATLEGNGVEPDVAVGWERESLLAGRDAALDAAIGWIESAR